MSISTPSVWSLNVRGLDWLNEELLTWENKAKKLFGSDLKEAQKYIEAVRAERDQRASEYEGGFFSTIAAGFRAPFEMLGGGGGQGASGLSASVSETAEEVATATKTYLYIIFGAVFILAGFVLWLKFRK